MEVANVEVPVATKGRVQLNVGGHKIELSPPEVATHFYLAKILGDQALNPYANGMARAIMFVKAVDGVEIRRPETMVELQNIANKIGDLNIEAVAQVVADRWKQPDTASLSFFDI